MNVIRGRFSDYWAKAFADSSHYLLASLFLKSLGFLVVPFLARVLSIEEFAVYDLFLTVYGLLYVLLGLGMDSGVAILLSEAADDRAKLSFLLVVSLVASAALGVVFWVLSAAALALFGFGVFDAEKWNLVCLYSILSLACYTVVNFSRWIGRVKTAAYVNLVSSVVGMLLGIAFISLFEPSVEYYLYGLTLGALVGCIVCLYIVRSYIRRPRFDSGSVQLVREFFNLSLPFVPTYLGNSLLQMSDRFLVIAILDMKALGLYALISRIASIPSVLVNVIRAGFLPVLLKNYQSPAGQRFVRQVFHAYVFALPAAILAAYFSAEPLVHFFGGEAYDQASPYLTVMVASALINSSIALNGFGYTIKRKTHQAMFITYIAVVMNIALSALLALSLGLAGIIIGTLSAAVIRAALYTYYSEQLYRFGYNLLAALGLISICCIASVAALLLSS